MSSSALSHLLDLHEMPDPVDHPPDLHRVGFDHRAVRPPESKRPDRPLMDLKRVDLAHDLCNFDFLLHGQLAAPASGAGSLKSSLSDMPRLCAMVRASMSERRPCRVAFTTLCGFDEPIDFVRMSSIPADSRTARTPPPAISPVPGDA